MRFEMLTEPKPLPGSKRSFHKAKGQSARTRVAIAARLARQETMMSHAMEQQVFGGEHQCGRVPRPLWTAMKRGLLGRCPHCGEGKLFRAFVKTGRHMRASAARNSITTAPTTCRPIW